MNVKMLILPYKKKEAEGVRFELTKVLPHLIGLINQCIKPISATLPAARKLRSLNYMLGGLFCCSFSIVNKESESTKFRHSNFIIKKPVGRIERHDKQD